MPFSQCLVCSKWKTHGIWYGICKHVNYVLQDCTSFLWVRGVIFFFWIDLTIQSGMLEHASVRLGWAQEVQRDESWHARLLKNHLRYVGWCWTLAFCTEWWMSFGCEDAGHFLSEPNGGDGESARGGRGRERVRERAREGGRERERGREGGREKQRETEKWDAWLCLTSQPKSPADISSISTPRTPSSIKSLLE